MKENFNLNSVTWSGSAFTTESNSVSLARVGFSIDASASLFIEEDLNKIPIQDLSGNSPVIFSKNITRGVRHSDSSSAVTGYFFGMEGVDSYLSVDYYPSIAKTSDFSYRCLAQINGTGKQLLGESSVEGVERFSYYYDSGQLFLSFTDLFGNTNLVEGPSITTTSLNAIGFSMDSSGIHFGLNGTELIVTTNSDSTSLTTFSLEGLSSGLTIGGAPDSLDCLVGNIGKPNYLTYATDFSDWLVEEMYTPGAPYFDAALATPTILNTDSAVAFGLQVNDSFTSTLGLGFHISYDQGNTWEIPRMTYPWSTYSSASFIATQATLGEMNQYLGEFQGSISNMMLRTFVNNEGLEAINIPSLSIYYVNGTNPIELVTEDSFRYGSRQKIIQRFFSAPHVSDSGTDNLALYIVTTSNQVLTASYSSVNTSIEGISTYIDGRWGDKSNVIGEGEKTFTSGILATNGAVNIARSVEVSSYVVTIEDLTFLGSPGQPTVSVYDTSEWPNPSVVDSYGLTVSGDVKVSLIPGSYKFVIQATNGKEYVRYETIGKDKTLSLQATGSSEPASRFTANTLDVEIDETTFATGDTPTLSFKIKSKDTGLATNLEDYSVYFAMKEIYTSVVAINRQCTITSAASGRAEIRLTSNDTDTAGRFLGEVSIEKDGEVQTVIPHIVLDIIGGIR